MSKKLNKVERALRNEVLIAIDGTARKEAAAKKGIKVVKANEETTAMARALAKAYGLI